jgi:hypothetical protein
MRGARTESALEAQPFIFATHVPWLKLFHCSYLWDFADTETYAPEDFVPQNLTF